MPIIKNEFALALNQVAAERGISTEEVVTSIEAAIVAAYYKEYPDQSGKVLMARVNRDTGEAHLYEGETDVTPPGFGRIAAQTARNVILQKIREAERRGAVSKFQQQIGSLVKGRIIRTDNYNAYVDINKTEAVLPRSEQMRGESYTPNTSMTFYLKGIEDDKLGRARIIVSRSHPNLLVELFKREVPELANNAIEIKAIVREPGERSKIAVWSNRGGIDPVGACVGQKGVRVQVVTDELGRHEKLDIIQWQPDIKAFITNALAPAKIDNIEIDDAAKAAKVTVKVSQAPLAIGRGGINVNLASRLTGLSIDIVQVPDEGDVPRDEVSAAEVSHAAFDNTDASFPTSETQTQAPQSNSTSESTPALQEELTASDAN
jgi:N utilization substance protein A